jgi:hypothetical protein
VRSRSAGRDDEQVWDSGDHVFANTVGEELLVGIAVFVCPHQPTVLGEIGGKDCRQPSLEAVRASRDPPPTRSRRGDQQLRRPF